MGFFKDVRGIQKQAEEMTPPEHRGIRGGFRAMKDLAATGNATLGEMHQQAQDAQRLMQVGRVGQATVMAIRDTGVTVNENPQAELDLQVAVEGTPPYMVTHRQVIARIALAGFQPGASVPVRVDPQDPHKLIVA
jgi:hypothetical protein